MTNKTTLVVLFTISVLLLGAVSSPLNLLQSAEALKGQGVSTAKYGSATKGKVCGDKLCSEVRAEEQKEAEKKQEASGKTQQKTDEQKKSNTSPAQEKDVESKMDDKNKIPSKTFTTKPSKIPTAKIIAILPSSGNANTVIFQVCASEVVNMRAPEVIISSDSAVENVRLNKIILKETCAKTASSIKAIDPSSISIKVIDKTKMNQMIEKAEKEIDRIENEIANINNQLQTKLKTIPDSSTADPEQIKEINEMISKLSELRKQKTQLKSDYYELIYTIQPN